MQRARTFLNNRQRAYQLTFNSTGEAGQDVLADLADFCRANESAFHPDPRVHAVLEGRREVWLRIQQHLQLSADDLWRLHERKQK